MTTTVEMPLSALPELVERARAGEFPPDAVVRVTYNTAATHAPAKPEEAPPTPEELEEERRIYEQLEANMNETRRALEMRTL